MFLRSIGFILSSLYIIITNQRVLRFLLFFFCLLTSIWAIDNYYSGLGQLIITASNYLVGDEVIFFSPVIILFILILLSYFFSNYVSLEYFKYISFALYSFIFLEYMFIFCYHVHNSGVNYFFYKTFYISNFFNFNVSFGIDNYTIFFLLLTSLLFPFCILINWEYNYSGFRRFIIFISILDISLICAFMSTNLFFFFFFFEITLIPMYYIVNLWGSRTRKVHAGFYFFLYTAFGSIFLLLGILLLYSMFKTTDIRILSNSYISYERQILL